MALRLCFGRDTDGVSLGIFSIIDEYRGECLLCRAARGFPTFEGTDCLEELLIVGSDTGLGGATGRWVSPMA